MQSAEGISGHGPARAGTIHEEQSAPPTAFTTERMQATLAALEDPFHLSEIKWRVTNTTKVNGRNGPLNCGQMLAYADPRAYTDRLNSVLGPAGWTRDYRVQMVQNFERKERGANERTITAKIVVTCRLTIHGLGTHAGLGEEWAENENAGTAAEAQAFKRACSCFGLGRYLYDLEGQWVDLDDRKQPVEKPRLPDWALPSETRTPKSTDPRRATDSRQEGNGTAPRYSRNGFYRTEVLEQAKRLTDAVGFSLSRCVIRSIAKVDDITKIRDIAKLTSVLEKLQDTGRGVQRLKQAMSKVGSMRYAQLCKEADLASDSIDDIPDRATLRRLIDVLEAESGTDSGRRSGGGDHAAPSAPTSASHGLVEARGSLLREATRVSTATRRSLADVINHAANGAFHFSALSWLGEADLPAIQAALQNLRTTKR